MLSVDLTRTTVPRAAPVSDENPISLKNINVYKKNKTNLHNKFKPSRRTPSCQECS